jgi:hypothetical protein
VAITRRTRAARDWASIAAALIGFATVIAYIAIIVRQETQRDDYPLIVFVTCYFAALSTAAFVSVSADTRRCVALRSAAAAGFMFWGLIAAASIGLPLLVAGLVALIALIRTLQVSPGTGVLATVVATVTVLTGITGLLIAASFR